MLAGEVTFVCEGGVDDGRVAVDVGVIGDGGDAEGGVQALQLAEGLMVSASDHYGCQHITLHAAAA